MARHRNWRNAKKLLRVIFGRTTWVMLSLVLQLAVMWLVFLRLSQYVLYFYGFSIGLGAIVLIRIISREGSSSIKLAWVVPILVLPVFGTMLYLFLDMQPGSRIINRRIQELGEHIAPYLRQEPEVLREFSQASGTGGNIAVYMNRYGRYPIYRGTETTYYPLGELYFDALLRELRRAKTYIFLEYFIISRGTMWDQVLTILRDKAAAGVEVRLMYDGMNWLSNLPHDFPRQMESMGIHCKVFSPIRPVLSSIQNNRDHRKIVVIDGHTAFTGGINIGDEYINRKMRFGHWKDTGIKVRGAAVASFTMMFLQLWNIRERKEDDYRRFLYPGDRVCPIKGLRTGFVMPYADSPLDDVNVGEQVYLDILQSARTYVHIMTPYLILDDTMLSALKYCARRGVDTSIIMPHIPDKIYAYLLARDYYEELIRAGVKIYEYRPGFVHAKVYVSDNEKAVVGSINMDYRSLYLHFESAVYLYRQPAVEDVEKDFQATLEKCIRIHVEDCRNYPLWKRFAGSALRLLAPLM